MPKWIRRRPRANDRADGSGHGGRAAAASGAGLRAAVRVCVRGSASGAAALIEVEVRAGLGLGGIEGERRVEAVGAAAGAERWEDLVDAGEQARPVGASGGPLRRVRELGRRTLDLR